MLRDVCKIASDYDLVVTTYQTLCAEYGKDGKVCECLSHGESHVAIGCLCPQSLMHFLLRLMTSSLWARSSGWVMSHDHDES